MSLLLPALLAALVAASPGATQKAKRAHDEATVLFDLGRYGEAAKLFEEAYRLRPDRVGLLFNAAAAHEHAYRTTGDAQSLGRALELYRNCRALRCVPVAQVDAALDALGRARTERERRAEEERLRAATGQTALELAGSLLEQGRPQLARGLAERVLGERGLSRVHAVEARRLLAYADSRMGSGAAAEKAFRELLSLSPELAAPAVSDQQARRAFDAARAALGGRFLDVVMVPLGDLRPGLPARLALEVRADPASLVREIVVAFRQKGPGAYAELRFPHPGAPPTLPAEFLGAIGEGAIIEYHARVLGEREAVLVLLGSADEPFHARVVLPVPPKPLVFPTLPPERSRWQVVGAVSTIAGGIVLAGGVTMWAVAKVLETSLTRKCRAPAPGKCTPDLHPDVDTYESARTLSYGALLVGSLATTAGIGLWVLGPESEGAPTGAGLTVTRRF